MAGRFGRAGHWRGPRKNPKRYWTLYALAWLLMAAPLIWDLWSGQTGGDSAREQANVDMGRWGVRFLVLALSLRPLAQALRWPIVLRYRRMVGLFAFAYTFAHSVDYFVYAHGWAIPYRVWQRRLYLWVGIAAFSMFIPLAVTSADGVRRAMGPAAWRGLHRMIYTVAFLTILHAGMELTNDYTQTILCGLLLFMLLILRLPSGQHWLEKVQLPRSAKSTGNTNRLAS